MSDLRHRLADLVGKLSVNNVYSWWGHAAQGVLFTALIGGGLYALTSDPMAPLVGVAFSEGAFCHREASGFLEDWTDEGLAYAWARAREDGLMDLMAPHVASFATALLIWAIL